MSATNPVLPTPLANAAPPGPAPVQGQATYAYLWKPGPTAEARAILDCHPELQANKSAVLGLAYEEYCQRHQAGEAVEVEAFCQRFPRYQSSLRRMLDAHAYYDEYPDLLPGRPVPWPQPGQNLLDFVLLRELGRGAFARVYLAVEPALGERLVTLKVTPGGAAEADTLGRLIHPNIVPVHQVRTDPATQLTVICMPYLGGATLCDLLDRVVADGLPLRARDILDVALVPALPEATAPDGRPPAPILRRGTYVDGVLHIAVQLAEALAFVHARGICHQDLKPSNVLLGPDGRPRLLDFNLATDVLTRQRCLGGTLPYMAPEQLRAVAARGERYLPPPDPRADLFALGVVLYELLGGTHPFAPLPRASSVPEQCRLLLERQRRGPRPLDQMNSQVGSRLNRLIGRCLAYRLEDRPPTAAELARSLRRALSPWNRFRRWLAWHRRATAAAAAVFLLAVGGVGYGLAVRDPLPVREYRQGMASYRQGQYGLAVDHFNASLQAAPAAPAVLLARGRAYLHLGDPDALRLALLDLQTASRLNPDGRFKACQAYCLNHLQLTDAAIAAYEQAELAGFAPAAVHNNLGYSFLLRGTGELDKAKDRLDRALELDGELVAAYHNRALYHLFKGLQDRTRSLQPGIDDIRQALAKAEAQQLPTAELCRDAARLCATAATREPGWTNTAWDYLERALREGFDPQKIRRDKFFAALAGPRFDALAQQPTLTVALPPFSRLVDPLHAGPADLQP